MSVNTAYLPVGEILTAASQEIADDSFGKATRPFYLSQAQRGLQDLCYDARWDKRHIDLPIPANRIVELPPDCIGLNPGVVLFNGDNCDFLRESTLYIKPNMYHRGGTGYVADLHPGQDALQTGQEVGWYWEWNSDPRIWAPNRLFYAGEFQGKLYLSYSCLAFDKIHIPYNSLGINDWCEDFMVPQWCREALTDYVIHKVALRLEQLNPAYFRGVIARKEIQLNTGNPNGTWNRALVRWKAMDSKQRSDLVMYLTRFGYQPH